jgi:hypothetical protein
MGTKSIVTEKDYINTLYILEKKGADGFGQLGKGMLAILAIAGGAAAAPTVAGIAGATTLLGSTTLAGALGGIFVVTTPVGWTIAVAAGFLGMATMISRFISNGARETDKRKRLKDDLKSKIQRSRTTMNGVSDNDKIKLVADALLTSSVQGKISKDQGAALLGLLIEHRTTPEYAMDTIQKLTNVC